MYCTQCGVQIVDDARYCCQCGVATANAPHPAYAPKRLMRSRTNKRIAGVCGGVAEYLEIDATLVRLLWLCFLFFPLPGALIAYIIGWIVMPTEPQPVLTPVRA